MFTTIDPQPLAAASLAQVHRARLHDGRAVAVKVQYPDIVELARTDLEALEVMVRLPGNLLVQPGPRLVVLDHGLNGALSPALGRALARMVRALVAGDADALRAALAEVGVPVDEYVDLTSLLRLAGVTLGGEHAAGTENGRVLGGSLGDLPVKVILVGRALSLLDGITRQLAPDLDVLAIVAHHAALPSQ